MATIYNFSRNALLQKIGLTPGKKLQVFLLSVVAITIPMEYVYNSLAIILFVVYSILAAEKGYVSIKSTLVLPMLLFLLMMLSLAWSIDFKDTLKALSKEASLLFIPLAFCLNRHLVKKGVKTILENYSIGMCLFGVFLLGRALVRYLNTADTNVFFYHELATNDVNAIYLSALCSLALFCFLAKKGKGFWGYAGLLFLAVFILLLSSKTIIIINVALVVLYYLFYAGLNSKAKIGAVALFLIAAGAIGYNSRIKDRIAHELRPNIENAISKENAIHNVTVREAWEQPSFSQNDYFNGVAFRVYQIRIFTEMLEEDGIFFTGYGLNTSLQKINAKGKEHNLYQADGENVAYNQMNFHNQYVEIFADLGIFGLILLLIILAVNFKNAVKNKDFVHIAFAIVMIALFLTESFLWRQRGIVFFTIFYCLFNSIESKGIDKKQHEKNTHNRSGGFFGVSPM